MNQGRVESRPKYRAEHGALQVPVNCSLEAINEFKKVNGSVFEFLPFVNFSFRGFREEMMKFLELGPAACSIGDHPVQLPGFEGIPVIFCKGSRGLPVSAMDMQGAATALISRNDDLIARCAEQFETGLMDFCLGNVKDASAEQADTAFGSLASRRFEQLIGIFFLE